MSDSRRLMPSTAVWAIDTLHQLVAVPDAHVYVHCVAGMVRSPTILWLYLIALGISPKDARTWIEARSLRANAGSSRMVDREHVVLAQMHGLMHYFPHPRGHHRTLPASGGRVNPPLAYLNGRLLPFAEAALPLHDAGFVSGATVVDNARTFRHALFRWPDHLARFRRDCAACYVPLDATDEQLTATAEELVAHNAKLLPPSGELQLVTFATPGPLGFYLGEADNGPATLGMVTYPLPFARYRRFFTEGVTLAVAGATGSVGLLSPRVKHRSRMFWHVADHAARERTGHPHALALPLGPNLSLTETGVANFLAVIDGAVVSPPSDTILDGISLRMTRELCGSLDLPFAESPVRPADALRATEAMLTGTGFCIAGVRDIHLSGASEGRAFTWPGPVFGKLLAAWSELVGVDIAKQFTG